MGTIDWTVPLLFLTNLKASKQVEFNFQKR